MHSPQNLNKIEFPFTTCLLLTNRHQEPIIKLPDFICQLQLIEISTDSSASENRECWGGKASQLLKVTPEMSLTMILIPQHTFYLSNWQIPTHSKEWPGSLPPSPTPQFKNTPLCLHSGKPAFIGPFVKYPFFPLIKRRKRSQGIVTFPLFFYMSSNNPPYLFMLCVFNALIERVSVCRTIVRRHHLTASLSFSGQMHWWIKETIL